MPLKPRNITKETKQTKVEAYVLNFRADVELQTGLGVCHQHDVYI